MDPHVIVLFGATGDLSRRKLLPGLYRTFQAGFLPEVHIVGTSLEDSDDDRFRNFALAACEEFVRQGVNESTWHRFAERLHFVPQSEGEDHLAAEVRAIE